MSPRNTSRIRRQRLALIGILALALCTAFGATFAASAEAKKGKKKAAPTFFQQSVSPNAAIPDDVATGPSIPLNSTITVGKKFKGKVVGDVNVTGIKTTGSADLAADDLGFSITAPSGQRVILLGPTFISGASIGPLTFDDDTFTELCYSPPCQYAPETLNPPYAGTANLLYNGSAGTGPLAQLNGSSMKGVWTFTAWDQEDVGRTSILNGWGLQITARKPVK
jgi:hypothetical protein